jgi:peptidoglycan hydrolase-like protein with peptidoglycan-binding domain
MPAIRRWLLLCTLLAAGALVVTVVHDDGTTAGAHRLGPSITAQTRDLATTLAASGNLQRDSESIVSYAGALSEAPPSTTLTSLLDVGATAERGTVLYTANEQAVVALVGDLPAWRTLARGVDAGADVRQLEENLAVLGYDPGTVDQTFSAATAAAVKAWETDLGRTAPDGEVSLGDVVFLTAPGDVLGHEAAVGEPLGPGAPVLSIGSEQRVVVAAVDATAAGGWAAGATVVLEWSDTTTTEGTVIGTGRDVTDGQVELTVALGTDVGDRRSGAAATATLVGARRDDVVAVPVAALVDDEGEPAVRVVQPDGADAIVPVATGLVADGWVEITAGLEAGEEVRLPG